MRNSSNSLAVFCLVTGALVWGLIWYPYRALEVLGMGGLLATFLTYLPAALAGLWIVRRDWRQVRARAGILVAIMFSAGWCNLAYVLAALRGEVMTVMLLFYLAPLWTVLFARLLVDERPGKTGLVVVGLALSGAIFMLWRPEAPVPIPRTVAEWLGLTAGMGFALSNVLSRRAEDLAVDLKPTFVCAGVCLVALPFLLFTPQAASNSLAVGWQGVLILGLVAVVIFAVNPVVQFGLAHVSANRAIVIFLSEIVFAALASRLLEGETMRANQWLGGTLVILATLVSAKTPAPKSPT